MSKAHLIKDAFLVAVMMQHVQACKEQGRGAQKMCD